MNSKDKQLLEMLYKAYLAGDENTYNGILQGLSGEDKKRLIDLVEAGEKDHKISQLENNIRQINEKGLLPGIDIKFDKKTNLIKVKIKEHFGLLLPILKRSLDN